MVAVRVYVEGGGDTRPTVSACREGFSRFFERLCPRIPRPRIVACGSRQDAYKRFRIALGQDHLPVLLVDAEGPVQAGSGAWAHLQTRDGWRRPRQASDTHAHLMVQVMESWFLADRATLRRYFGQGFKDSALPGRSDVELISKEDVESALEGATRSTTTKGSYHKTRHGFDILALIDPSRVCKASAHAERLRQAMESLCEEE